MKQFVQFEADGKTHFGVFDEEIPFEGGKTAVLADDGTVLLSSGDGYRRYWLQENMQDFVEFELTCNPEVAILFLADGISPEVKRVLENGYDAMIKVFEIQEKIYSLNNEIAPFKDTLKKVEEDALHATGQLCPREFGRVFDEHLNGIAKYVICCKTSLVFTRDWPLFEADISIKERQEELFVSKEFGGNVRIEQFRFNSEINVRIPFKKPLTESYAIELAERYCSKELRAQYKAEHTEGQER